MELGFGDEGVDDVGDGGAFFVGELVEVIAPPGTIDGATVLSVADVSEVAPTGRTRHIVRGEEVRAFSGLAIATYDDNPGVYLLYCDEQWRSITDTFHESIAAATAQAEFEFGPLTFIAVED